MADLDGAVSSDAVEEAVEDLHYVVTSRVRVQAGSFEDAAAKSRELFARGNEDELAVAAETELLGAVEFYADPDSYFAIFIEPDRPAGEFADDVGCVIGPHGDHDHRHGRRARAAMGREWWGTEPCEEMLAQIANQSG